MQIFKTQVKDPDENIIYEVSSPVEDEAREQIATTLYNWGIDKNIAQNMAEGVLLKMRLRKIDWFLAAVLNETSFEVYIENN